MNVYLVGQIDQEMSFNEDELLMNIEKLHTTELGAQRIRKNINLFEGDVIEWCKKQISREEAIITRQGKNWYIDIDNYEITVNANSLTVITAHKGKKHKGANSN